MTREEVTMSNVVQEAREFIEAHWTPGHDLAAWRELVVDNRWAALRWPEDSYGRGLSDDEAEAVEKVFSDARVPGPGQDKWNLWAGTLVGFGSSELKKQYVRSLLLDEVAMCLLYSEPGAGSDLAGIRTTAVCDGDEWVINGQKVWTSGAHHSDMGVLLARTGDAPRNRGISMLLIPMKQPGVEVRPLRQMTGEAEFNEVFFTNARVPRDWVIGDVNDGWRAATGLLAHERSSLGKVGADEKREATGSAAVPFHYLADAAHEFPEKITATVRQDLARAYTGEKLMDWLGQRSVHPSVGKLWRTKQSRFVASVIAQLALDGSLACDTNDKAAAFWRYHILNAPRMSLGGGTDEIQKNTIGERALGLPREPS